MALRTFFWRDASVGNTQPMQQSMQPLQLPDTQNQNLSTFVGQQNQTAPSIDFNRVFADTVKNNPNINELSALNNEFTATRNAQQDIANYLADYEKRFSPYLEKYVVAQDDAFKQSMKDLDDAKNAFLSAYWPEWEQRKRLEKLYADQAQFLANEQARQEWAVMADAKNAWLSANAIRLAKSDIAFNNYKALVDLKSREVQDYQNLYDRVNQYLDNLVKTKASLRDNVVKNIYDRVLWFRDKLESVLFENMANLRNAQFQIDLADQIRRASSPWSLWVQMKWQPVNEFDWQNQDLSIQPATNQAPFRDNIQARWLVAQAIQDPNIATQLLRLNKRNGL